MFRPIFKISLVLLSFFLLISTSPAMAASAGTFFPPQDVEKCNPVGFLSWIKNGSVSCKKLPPAACTASQAVTYDGDGFKCVEAANLFNCGAYTNGQVWTNTCPTGQTGLITNTCTNGTITTSSTCRALAACGPYPSGQSWTEACPSDQTGSITKICNNGTTSITATNCQPIVPPVMCGSYTVGQTWAEMCADGRNMYYTRCMADGSTSVFLDNCGSVPSGTGPCPPGQQQRPPFGHCM